MTRSIIVKGTECELLSDSCITCRELVDIIETHPDLTSIILSGGLDLSSCPLSCDEETYYTLRRTPLVIKIKQSRPSQSVIDQLKSLISRDQAIIIFSDTEPIPIPIPINGEYAFKSHPSEALGIKLKTT